MKPRANLVARINGKLKEMATKIKRAGPLRRKRFCQPHLSQHCHTSDLAVRRYAASDARRKALVITGCGSSNFCRSSRPAVQAFAERVCAE